MVFPVTLFLVECRVSSNLDAQMIGTVNMGTSVAIDRPLMPEVEQLLQVRCRGIAAAA